MTRGGSQCFITPLFPQGRVEFFSSVIYVSFTHMVCACTHVHTYTYKFTETKNICRLCMYRLCTVQCNSASHHTCHIHLQRYVMMHHSPMSHNLYNIHACYASKHKKTHSTHTPTHARHSQISHIPCVM